MRILFVITAFLFTAIFTAAQSDFEIRLLPTLNNERDNIACTLINGELVYMTSEEVDLVDDYKWNAKPMFHLCRAQRGDTYSDWTSNMRLFERKLRGDEGPASYDPVDSVLYFSSPENLCGNKGNNLKIYMVKFMGEGWSEPTLLPLCDTESDYTHPYFDPKQKLLVFSSNRQGGFGKMDIWFSYKVENGWSEPVNPGMMVNTEANEIFPSVYDGDIYYATNMVGGMGGFDLYKALRSQQWKSSIMLEAPFNSPSDDISVVFLHEDKALISSNRVGGQGGDDIYVLERKMREEEKHDYKAVLECDGTPLSGVTIFATNEFDEIALREKSDSSGAICISSLKLTRNYRMQLAGIDPGKYESCSLSIYDSKGNKLRSIKFNMSGFADLELLPLSYSSIKLLSLEDRSLLNINIEGQLFDKQPGDIGRDEPVTILDDSGNPVAIAYTNDIGKFRFTKVEPQMDYTFRLSPETAASHVLITNKGDRITLPVLSAEVHYQRVNPSDAIELVNEYNQKIIVSAKDIFVINRIYYEYNSAQLTGEAKRQLDQLQILLDRNKTVGLELRSHTDSRGKDEYNMILSEKRAISAVNYLVGKGLERKRFKAVGLGETLLLNECDDGVTCSDPEHSINRRTEIRLTKVQ